MNLAQSPHSVWSLNIRLEGSDLLHVLVEAKSSLYLCTQSSLKSDFTRLMWDDRWILGRESDKQITGELRIKPFIGWVGRAAAVWTYTHFSNLWICSSLYANSEVKIGKGIVNFTMNKKSNKFTVSTNQQINTLTTSNSVFTIMLMNCHYLLQQHLHLLTAAKTRGQSSNTTCNEVTLEL